MDDDLKKKIEEVLMSDDENLTMLPLLKSKEI